MSFQHIYEIHTLIQVIQIIFFFLSAELSQVFPHTPWARSFWAFSPYLNHLQKFSILYYQKVATLPLFVTAKIQKISKNAQLYYQKVVNLPFFVTVKAQTKAFTMIYKQKVVVLPLFVTFPFSRSPKMT